MIATLRKLFGLCTHNWVHGTNVMTLDGPREGLYCTRCHKLKWRVWPKDQ